VPEIARCHPELYEELLAAKVTAMEELVTAAVVGGTPDGTDLPALPEIEVFESERTHFRMRAGFATWRDGDDFHYVMFNRDDTRNPREVRSYPMGSLQLNALMKPLHDGLAASDTLRGRINDVRFLTTKAGDCLVSITYNKPIGGGEWEEAACDLSSKLGGLKIVGRSRKVKVVVGGETVQEVLDVPGRGPCRYTQTEGAFTQPNAKVCEAMLGWAYDATLGLGDTDLCELYCGNGCFTVALAPNFRTVVATELSKASVALAQANIAANDVPNVHVARLSAEDFADAYAGRQRFARLEEAGIVLGARPSAGGEGAAAEDGMRMETIFVDPPRAGLDPVCRTLAAKFERVVYVSCNPETLARDLEELAASHSVVRLAAFDQFPYTPHLECGVVLQRREPV